MESNRSFLQTLCIRKFNKLSSELKQKLSHSKGYNQLHSYEDDQEVRLLKGVIHASENCPSYSRSTTDTALNSEQQLLFNRFYWDA